MRARAGAAFIATAAVLGSNGCAKQQVADPVIAIDELPAPALKAAREKLPGVHLENAWKEKVGGEDAFEVRGRTPEGKIRDVKVTASGRVLEVD